jgi:hypothetical protein
MFDIGLQGDDPCEGNGPLIPVIPFLFAYLVRLRRCGEAR